MPEPYAVKWTDGKKEVYWTKADYLKGRHQSSDAARKREERALGKARKKKKQIKKGQSILNL
jgi:hypothetical protein|uniref:Uncharacterized protein n=1 Tax=Siphoviridae sp. ctGkF12 TaxID=2826224 RepID=A0A8S5M8E4_9CAUD|nr:MAG TPA: hypothetical protein [Siphoviridae sp. ctGkF12]DAO90763.1 MAG TPA: hypothetical protein [Caudoviricetes sp.]DAR57124.1 MAG TPA: hypothetical protein [Caudoviricetes sp.]DAY02602.1 MAG TPA: hypothetical protein [Caudoviricetes sp.]